MELHDSFKHLLLINFASEKETPANAYAIRSAAKSTVSMSFLHKFFTVSFINPKSICLISKECLC